MSITFREMLEPTEVENYPDGKAPARRQVRAALPRQARAAARRKRPRKVRRLLPLRRRLPLELHLHRGRRQHQGSPHLLQPSATPRPTTSTTTAASSAATAWKPAPPTPSPTATASNWPASTPPSLPGHAQGRPASRPDASRRPGEWIARYVQRQLRATTATGLDYALMTHLHGDHVGQVGAECPDSQTGKYKLTGISDVTETVPIGKADRSRISGV
jgi:hypothetical protein